MSVALISKQLSSPHLVSQHKPGFFAVDPPPDTRPVLQKFHVEPDSSGLPGGESYLRGDPIPGLTHYSCLPLIIRILLFPILFPIIIVLLLVAIIGLWGFTIYPVITGICCGTKDRLEKKSSKTAQLVCGFRYIGYQLALTNDHLAYHFLPFGSPSLIRLLYLERLLRGRGRVRDGGTGLVSFIIARTQVFDRLIINAIGAGYKQVVLLGAGFDDRAHRLACDGVQFFEVDVPTTQALKYQICSRYKKKFNGKVVYVPCDFSTENFMTKLSTVGGFDKSKPSVFILEGVIMYLEWNDVKETLSRIATCCSKTLLGCDCFEDGWSSPEAKMKALYGMKILRRGANGVGEPFRWGLRTDHVPRKIFGDLGFGLLAHLNPSQLETRFLLPPKEEKPVGKVAEFGHVFLLRVMNDDGVLNV
jgi:methyltransferase (TIGR00027 family)